MTEIKTPNGIPVVASVSAKRCTKCGEYKPYAEFYRDRTKPDGYMRYCKFCASVQSKKHTSSKTEPETKSPQTTLPQASSLSINLDKQDLASPATSLVMRKCKYCGKIKPLNTDNFYKAEDCRGGFEPTCIECRTARRLQHNKSPKIKTPTALKTSPSDISLDNLDDDTLIAELKRRGYTGELEKTTTIKLAI